MHRNFGKYLKPAILAGAFIFMAGVSFSAQKAPEPPKETTPPYERGEALGTIINPHEQINDAGEILWGTCTVCHKQIPDIKKEHSIKDVQLHFEDNPNEICTRCHLVKKHPGTEGASVTMSGYAAPDHLVVPSSAIATNMRISLKDVPTILPLDPKSGKIICATCHNPHERGLLTGRADWGADFTMRLRSAGLDICQYCHRK
ncbi:MAG: hypothetical protein HYS21_09460 [Deltaproteobacteria bacterium]|nr:hypothetical protein [Deltaproteobacteria bacterium]